MAFQSTRSDCFHRVEGNALNEYLQHPTLEVHNQEQVNLKAAKAAFFASGGTAQFIRPGVGKDSPGISHEPKRPYGYARIAPQTKCAEPTCNTRPKLRLR